MRKSVHPGVLYVRLHMRIPTAAPTCAHRKPTKAYPRETGTRDINPARQATHSWLCSGVGVENALPISMPKAVRLPSPRE